jgi:hypothetical protein
MTQGESQELNGGKGHRGQRRILGESGSGKQHLNPAGLGRLDPTPTPAHACALPTCARPHLQRREAAGLASPLAASATDAEGRMKGPPGATPRFRLWSRSDTRGRMPPAACRPAGFTSGPAPWQLKSRLPAPRLLPGSALSRLSWCSRSSLGRSRA